MRAIDLIEAIQPKGPRKIPTGGRGSINNPAYDQGAYYEGDPAGFDFKAQRKNYENLKAALARVGKKLEYIAVARSPSGPDTFVATAPGVVWQKYIATDQQSAQNNIYISGKKFQLSRFVGLPLDQQDIVLGGGKAEINLFISKDPFTYVAELVKNSKGPEINAALTKHRKLITDLIVDNLQWNEDKARDLKASVELLKANGVSLPWFNMQKFVRIALPRICKRMAEYMAAYPLGAIEQIKSYNENGIRIDVKELLDESKHDIIRQLLLDIKRGQSVLNTVNILQKMVDWPELAAMRKSLLSK